MSGEKMQVRIAFRVEGSWWNAYLAMPDTIEGAILMASMPIRVAKESPEITEAFKELCRQIFEHALGHPEAELRYEEYTAPEHERSGSA